MKKLLVSLFFICVFGTALADPAAPANTNPYANYLVPTAPDTNAAAYILVDANSGKILAEKNADVRRSPASLTKLMSLYLVFKELSAGHLKLNDTVLISKAAWKMGGSRMFVKAGEQVPVDDLIQGVIVASGNDATTALAEHIAGSESVFVQMMDQQAKLLGMNDSNYTDPTGLPNRDHYSTADDLSRLAIAIIKNYPQYYHYFSEKWFTWSGIRQPNRNRLLWRDDNVDGLKTGHTDDAGYCLIASAEKNGMRLVAVVLGERTEAGRINDSEALLKYGFKFFETHKLYSANQSIAQLRVWNGADKMVNIGLLNDYYITVPNGAYKDVKLDMQSSGDIQAPVAKGQQLGTLNVMLNGQTIMSTPVVALQDNPKGGVFRRGMDWLRQKL